MKPKLRYMRLLRNMKADKISWLGLIGLIVILGTAVILDGNIGEIVTYLQQGGLK